MTRNVVMWIGFWAMIASMGQAAEPEVQLSGPSSLARSVEQVERSCKFDGESLDLTGSSGGTTDHRLADLKTTSPKLKALTIHRSAITDDGFKHLRELVELRSLTIGLQPKLIPQASLGDAALNHLVELKKLECLSISAQKVTEDGVAQLKHLPNLLRLNLNLGYQTEVVDRHAHSVSLVGLGGSPRTSLSRMSLFRIGKLKQLEELTLAGYSFSGDDLSLLGGLTELRSLDLAFTDVDDEDIKHLSVLEHLEILDLRGTRTTPQGVAHLTKLKNLQVKGWGIHPVVRTDDCFVHWLVPTVMHTNRSTGEMTPLAGDQHMELPLDKMGQLPGTRVTARRVRVIKHDDEHVYVLITKTGGVRYPFALQVRNDSASATIYAYRLSDARAMQVWEVSMQPKETAQDFVSSAIRSFELSDGGVTCKGKQFLTRDDVHE